MSSFSDPIYEITTITNNLCSFEAIGLSEYDNRVNDSTYIYSGLTLILGYVDFESHFDTDEHMYSNVILSNDVYTYTGITGETHYFEIVDFYLGADHFIDPLLNLSTEGEVIDGFTTDIIHCVEQLDGLSGTCCPTQQVLTSLPIVFITNEGGGSDNCDDFIARRTPRGWTLDFVFNKNGDVNTQESVFWFTGVRDEYDIENYADNGLSFKLTTDGKIMWSAYRFSGYCDSSAEYQELFYIETGSTANSLCSGGTSNDFSIIITFERYNEYEDECDLANQGGWNDLIWTGTTETLIKKWTDERNKRLGILKIYHNGKPIYKLKGFEETVLSDRGYQPFTHVIGGGVTGSGGIHEGSFCYSIKRAAYYEEPMTFLDVQTHYNTNISPNFTINDCSTPCTDNIVIVTPSRTPTMTITPSVTPTITRTPSITPTITRTPSITPTPAGINSVLGLLYNGRVISDVRGLLDPDWHIPTVGDFNILISNLGGSTVAGGELKEVDGSYWNTPNIGATNSSNFTARGAGRRSPTGIFERILDSTYFWTSSQLSGSIYYIYNINYSSSFFYLGNSEIERGLSIRPVKNTTTLSHGQMGTYTGKDGRIYRTIAIGTGTTQEWLVGNLAETQYQNGDIITEVRDASAWSNLTSPACCAYDNNWTYVSGVAPTPTPSMTLTPTITPSNPYWSTRYPDNLYGSVLTGVTGTTIYLTWTNNGTQDYDNIIIERSADSGSTYSEINSILSGEIEYIDETILDIQTYYYRVRYKLNTAYSIYSNIYIITEDELLSSYWINLIFTQDEQFYLLTEDDQYYIMHEPPPPPGSLLKLTFDDIVNVPVADASSVSDWNTWFDLPTNGTPFTSVSVDGNDVILTGGSNIKLKDNLFYVDDILFTSLLEFVDSGCITEVGDYCFFGCTSLANLSFSENLIKIGEWAFCGGIFTEFTIPNSVTTIGTSALYYCVQLTNIVFGTGLSELPGSLFDSCSSLTDIIIPNHITFLGGGCFNNCISLKTVTFLGCTVVWDDCFMNNGGTMTDVYYYCMIAPIILYIGSAFQTGSAKVLHIPIGATGYDVEPWTNLSQFSSIVQDL